MVVGKPIFGVGEKLNSLSPVIWWLRWALGAVSSESKPLNLETLTCSLHCRALSQSIVSCGVVTSSYIVLTRQPTSLFLGKSSGVSSSEQKHIYISSYEQMQELWKERLYSCAWPDLSVLTQCVKGRKWFSTCFLWPSKNISLSNNVNSHIVKSNQRSGAPRGAAAGKQETQPL